MRNPSELYHLTPDAVEVPAGLELVIALTGFADAGGASSQFTTFVLESIESTPVAVFDNDHLLDYRARRPVISFAEDHFLDYRPARLELSLAQDDVGRAFLLLTGYEPDFTWDGFVTAVLELVVRFEVAGTTWIHSIPMPVPHTRPLGLTVSGTRASVIEDLSVWRPHTQLPANVLHVIELRLTERALPVTGLAILVPHYLADTEYPAAAVAALDAITAATGIVLPSDELRESGREFLAKVDEQVAGNSELARLVTTLEERYDSYMDGNAPRSPLMDSDGELPTADEIAAELERFLAARGDESGDIR